MQNNTQLASTKQMLQPKAHGLFASLPAAGSVQSSICFSLQMNLTRVRLEVAQGHLSQMLSERSHPNGIGVFSPA